MTDDLSVFRRCEYKINDYLTIKFPTLGEIEDFGENEYFGTLYFLCSTPSDHLVMLHDAGIDWEDVNEFEFFSTAIWNLIDQNQLSLIFKDIDLVKLIPVKDKNTQRILIVDNLGNHVLDEITYQKMVTYLRDTFGFEKNVKKPGTQATKDYFIESERERLSKQNKQESFLLPLMKRLVNHRDFPYDYESVWNLPINWFMESVRTIPDIKSHEALMQGIYSGNVDTKKMNKNDLSFYRN